MGGTYWSDRFSAEWHPITSPDLLAKFAPHTHIVYLLHDDVKVDWDVCGADQCEATAEKMHQTAI